MRCFPFPPDELKVRHLILGQNFSEHNDKARLVSMSRFSPADHQDCIVATEFVTNHATGTRSSVTESPLSSSQPNFLFQTNSLSNALRMSAAHRKYFSVIALLLLVSLFCIISSSLVDILAGSQHDKYLSLKEKDGTASNELSSVLDTSHMREIELDEIFQNELNAEFFNGSWVSPTEIAFYDTEYNLCLYHVLSKTTRHHIRFMQVLTRGLKELQLSSDRNYLLWPLETIEIFRHSKLEKLKIYDIRNNSLINLFSEAKFHDSLIQFGLWGPQDSQLVFVYNNNLYYKHSARSAELQLTISGIPGVIFNGHSDWLYEEELLSNNQAVWFSPEGHYLAYLQINDTLVDVISWNRYGDYYNISSNQYPTRESIRYPKPGTANPQVTLYVTNLHWQVEKIHIVKIRPPAAIAKQDHYVSRVVWFDEHGLLVVWTTRDQTHSSLVLCDLERNWNCGELYTLKSTSGWVDGFERGLLSAANLKQVVVRIPRMVNAEKGDFYHIATIDITSKKVKYLTNGQYDVIKLIAYSPVTREVFYASTLSNHPEVQHIMKISLGESTAEAVCLTCYLGNSCRFNEAHFNSLATYYVLECKGYEIPRVELRDAQTNELIETLEENRRLFQFLKNKHIPRYEKIYVKLADNYDAIVEFILPHNFDEQKQYPLVIELYGAPDTQMIKDKYEMNHWSLYLTSKHQFIYARVDVRGTSNQGLRHMHQLYKNVGHIEVDDLIDVVWFLKSNFTYVDSSRIALWGWSYGGYMSLMSLIREFDNRLFSCAIAVAPVSNWMYYDSAYSERYLGMANQRNLYSYQDSNLLDNAILLKNKKFLLVFGTRDDNVHIQHSLLLIRKLNELNIDYDVQIYPDDNHYLLRSAPHLYRKMSNYIRTCFHL